MTYHVWLSSHADDSENLLSLSSKINLPDSVSGSELKLAMREATLALLSQNGVESTRLAASGWFPIKVLE